MERKLKSNRIMKLQLTIIFVIASFMLITLGSCSSTEDLASRYPYLSQLKNTECLGSRAADIEADNDVTPTFEIRISGKTAECFFKSLEYPCDFEKVNVKVFYENGTIKIVEYPSSDLADCICDVDATFKIEELPEDSFILKIFRANTKGEYNNNYPTLTETIKVKNGSYIFPYNIGSEE